MVVALLFPGPAPFLALSHGPTFAILESSHPFTSPESPMVTIVMVLLGGLSVYLGAQLHAAVAENSALRANIEILKRRLRQA